MLISISLFILGAFRQRVTHIWQAFFNKIQTNILQVSKVYVLTYLTTEIASAQFVNILGVLQPISGRMLLASHQKEIGRVGHLRVQSTLRIFSPLTIHLGRVGADLVSPPVASDGVALHVGLPTALSDLGQAVALLPGHVRIQPEVLLDGLHLVLLEGSGAGSELVEERLGDVRGGKERFWTFCWTCRLKDP